MRNIKTNTEEITDLKDTPLLRKLLINYCLIQYEQNAILDDEHLLREYFYLKKIDAVEELFNSEILTKVYSVSDNNKK